MNLLSIRAMNPVKYSLSLMDALFKDEEMNGRCFYVSARGKKPQLPEKKIKLIQGNKVQ